MRPGVAEGRRHLASPRGFGVLITPPDMGIASSDRAERGLRKSRAQHQGPCRGWVGVVLSLAGGAVTYETTVRGAPLPLPAPTLSPPRQDCRPSHYLASSTSVSKASHPGPLPFLLG